MQLTSQLQASRGPKAPQNPGWGVGQQPPTHSGASQAISLPPETVFHPLALQTDAKNKTKPKRAESHQILSLATAFTSVQGIAQSWQFAAPFPLGTQLNQSLLGWGSKEELEK